MKLILIAYKISPFKGSEDGSGYHLTKALLEHYPDLTLITRKNNIMDLQNDQSFKDATLIGIDVPKWLGFFKNKDRGIILYYYLWQICVGLKIIRLQMTQKYDVIHHLNFHATWAPHFLFSRNAKIIWGQISHHFTIPRRFWFGSAVSFYKNEVLKNLIKRIFRYVDPFVFWAAKRSKTIFYSAETILWPHKYFNTKIKIIPFAGSVFKTLEIKQPSTEFNILFVGRFENLKGPLIFLKAIEDFAKNISRPEKQRVLIRMIGQGTLYTDIMASAQIISSALEIQVEVLPWKEQRDLQSHYEEASLFFFPSFEAQGMVVTEALSQGCPVLCFQETGPSMLAGEAGIVISHDHSLSGTIQLFSDEIQRLFKEFTTNQAEYQKRVDKALNRSKQLDWDVIAENFIKAYHAD